MNNILTIVLYSSAAGLTIIIGASMGFLLGIVGEKILL